MKKEINISFSELSGVIAEECIEILGESKSRSMTMYAEDWYLRKLGEANYGTKGFGTRALLDVLHQKELITEKQYHNAIVDLVALNYHFINIPIDTLKFAVVDAGFFPSDRTIILFDSLRHKDNNVEFLINLAVQFLGWLWIETLPLEKKEQWTDIILNRITFNRNARLIIGQLHYHQNEMFSYLIPDHIILQFKNALRSWVQSTPII